MKLTAIQALYNLYREGDLKAIDELKEVEKAGEPGLQAFVKELLADVEEPLAEGTI